MSWFRRIVMAQSLQCVLGNTLPLNVSQDKKYLSRTYQQWPWKKSRPKKKIRQVLFHVIFVNHTSIYFPPSLFQLVTIQDCNTFHVKCWQKHFIDIKAQVLSKQCLLNCQCQMQWAVPSLIKRVLLWNIITSANRNQAQGTAVALN